MPRSRSTILLGVPVVAAVGWLIADRADFGLWTSLALLLGLLVGFAALTAPFFIASSERFSESEREVLGSLLRRDEALQLGAPWLAQVGFGTIGRRHTQRAFDIAGAFLLLVLLSPLMIAIAIAVKIESRGPVLFRRSVIGRGGEAFTLHKFRSMYVDAEERRGEMQADPELSDGIMFKIRDDPRVTRVGRFIRRFSLDDLPQLFNVLKGEMSLVGPPALVYEYKDLFGLLLLAKPGVTGVWKILEGAEVTAPDLARAELVYFVNRSAWSDLMLCTVGRYSMRRRAITAMWNLAAEDRVAGVELEPKEGSVGLAEPRSQLLLIDPELAPKRSIG